MSTLRIQKVNERVKQIIAELIRSDISLKSGIIVTIAKVDTTKDLRYTRVFFSVFPETEAPYVSETLKKESGRLKRSLFRKLGTRPSPQLSFELDTTEQEADKVERLLKDLF